MSYSCEISFKNLKPENVYDFLVEYKKAVSEHLEDIAKENVWYSPLLRHDFEYDWAKASYTNMSVDLRDKIDTWASKVFQFRYFYLPEHNLLGIFGVPDSVKEIFDNTIYFQNSTDQDYDFDDWKGVPWFEEIAVKWKNCSLDELVQTYNGIYGDDSDYHHMTNAEYLSNEEESIYYRKSFCYKDIWSSIEQYLFHDDGVVYLSLFGFYDAEPMRQFSVAIYKSAKDEVKNNNLLLKNEIWKDEKEIQNACE